MTDWITTPIDARIVRGVLEATPGDEEQTAT